MKLDGRVAVVTGGGSGIGLAIAGAFAREGARIAICGRDPGRLEAALAGLGPEARAFPQDVTDAATLPGTVDRIAGTLGPIAILVNNAGAYAANDPAAPGPDPFDEIVETNLHGTYRMTRAALARWQAPPGGRIINISSVLGKMGVPRRSAYCAAKHAVIGLTRAWALDLADRGITVNAICPGWVDTDAARRGFREIAEDMGKTEEEARTICMAALPLRRILEPAEVAALALYLASDEAHGMTGQAITLDCGVYTG